MSIQAIETEYKGYKFRSRLEARWTVFFDSTGIEYQYEPEEFIGVNGELYLPDFFLPNDGVYAEVKGTDKQLKEDICKILGVIDFNATPVADGLIILGEIPNYEEFSIGNILMFPYLFHEKNCIKIEHAVFFGRIQRNGIHVIKGNDNIISNIFAYDCDTTSAYDSEFPYLVSTTNSWTAKSLLTCTNMYNSTLIDAYKKARQARFEHGANPWREMEISR